MTRSLAGMQIEWDPEALELEAAARQPRPSTIDVDPWPRRRAPLFPAPQVTPANGADHARFGPPSPAMIRDVRLAHKAGLLSRNEAREWLGLPRRSWWKLS